MIPLLTIAGLTLREASRRRLLIAVALLTLVLIAFTGWGFSRLMDSLSHGGGQQAISHAEQMATVAFLVILIAYMGSVILAVGSAFLAAPAVSAEVESGVLLAILPRPIRRSDVVLGKWVGLCTLVIAYTAGAGALELAVVRAITGYWPPHPWAALAFLAVESIILLTVALLASTRLSSITGGIIAVGLFGAAWIAGIAEALGATFNNHAIVAAGTAVGLILPTDGFWRSVIYNLEPSIMIAAGSQFQRGNPFGVTAPPPTPFYVWTAGWLIVVLGLSVLSFNRRDL